MLRVEELFYFFITLISPSDYADSEFSGAPSPSFMAGYSLTNTTGTASAKKRRENEKNRVLFSSHQNQVK
ncbi:hypothetical protein [Dickeya undicola]|uniref:hypothetical protein n=1 Tax=Dickeya undicola TaxID=1577887 RepID=UPI0011CE657B|nr:hypothetical protein [Dickeya undicola]